LSQYQLAQLNIAQMKEPLESPAMADFVGNLDRINALADGSPGFVWRLQTEEGDATALRPMGENILVNLSVWKDVASLNEFVYKTGHAEILRRRKEWFEGMLGAFVVLWWVPMGHRPSVEDAMEKLKSLQQSGPTLQAFTFRQTFLPSGSAHEIRLRDVTEEDLPIFFEQQLDPDATKMAAFPARGRDAFMGHWTKIMSDEAVILKTIILDGQVAGNVVSWEQSAEREVGYWIGKEYWGKGIATQALTQFLGYVKTRPLYAHVAKHNFASIRVLEKCGFMISGEDKFPAAGGEVIEEYILKLEA